MAGNLVTIKKPRLVSFYDTGGFQFRSNSYVFRERTDTDRGKREVTLKLRHPDRYVSQDKNSDTARNKKGETKFEEDIKPPFTTLYSFSTTQPISRNVTLNCLGNVLSLFPELKKHLGPILKKEPVDLVGSLVAQELVIVGAKFQISRKPKVDSECALIVWYRHLGLQNEPLVVEFSFRYGNKRGKYRWEAALRAHAIFARMQKALAGWIDQNSPTKTAFVYQQADRTRHLSP
jgi:hypothetical protein